MDRIIRQSQNDIISLHARDRGRLLVLTGARQTGKSTLAAMAFPDYPVVSLDSPVERAAYQRMGPAEWIARFPRAVIDEAQKLPEIFDTIKACYDRDPGVRYVLLGSSQIRLLASVGETLAGRAALRELYPFSLPELARVPGEEAAVDGRVVEILRAPDPADRARALVPQDVVAQPGFGVAHAWWSRYCRFGGMPAIWAPGFTDTDREEWLRDYHATYLQRDLVDLARLDRLEPFVRAQKAAALRAGQPINIADLARLADVSPPTARQFMRYLEVSYQIAWLPAWHRNQEKRLSKRPKLHFLDPGVRRAVAGRRGDPDGAEYEGALVAEVVKQLRTARLPVEAHHLRTVDGREVDLLLERSDGYVAVECKQTDRVHPGDFRHLRRLGGILDKPLLLGLVVSEDPSPVPAVDGDPRLMALPAAALLGAAGG